MLGKKILVAAVIIRLHTRRGDLMSVLEHLRASIQVAPHELTLIQAAHAASKTTTFSGKKAPSNALINVPI